MHPIIGHWSLIDYTIFTQDGLAQKWQGSQVGELTYFPNQSLSLKIERTNQFQILTSENRMRLNIWYKGTFKVVNENTVIHNIHESSIKERIGKNLTRNFAIKEDKLTIQGQGLNSKVELIWKKTKNTRVC